MRRLAIVALVVLAGCEDTVPVWELDNDRIIAVRATPPHIPAGASATLDAFVTRMGEGPAEALPSVAMAAPMRPDQPPPPALAAAVAYQGGQWTVTAPSEEVLAQLRVEQGLMPGAPVPLLVGLQIEFASGPLLAAKRVMLGEAKDNPALGDVTVGGAPAADGMVIAKDTDVQLHATAGETDEVDWLTSVGELSDEDDADAVLNHDTTVDPPHLLSGHLAVVKRDEDIGVTWAFWTISVAP